MTGYQELADATTQPTKWWRVTGVVPVFSMFFLESFVLGNWIPRIPDVKTLFDFSATQLGICLFTLASGTLIAFLVGGNLIRRIGFGVACALSLPIWTLGILFVPFMPNGVMLGVLLFGTGMGIGLLEIAMNTAADKLERQSGRRLMSKAHGFWSLGSLAGALMGGAIAASGVDTMAHFSSTMPIIAIVGVVMALKIPKFRQERAESDSTTEKTPVFKLPSAGLMMLCIMPLGIMLVEGAFIDWSALFVRDVLNGGPMASGLIYAAFSLVMASTRLYGDSLLDKYGPFRIARISALAATVGILIFALAPNAPVAFIGALFAGLGTAIFYPLTMTAAAGRPGDAEDNVAAVSLFAFTGFMIAPPLLGFIADAAGLRIALVMLAPLAALSYVLSKELKKDEN